MFLDLPYSKECWEYLWLNLCIKASGNTQAFILTQNALSIQSQAFDSNEIAITLPHCHHTLVTRHYVNLFIAIKLNMVWRCTWIYLTAKNVLNKILCMKASGNTQAFILTQYALSIQPQALDTIENAFILPHCHNTLITMHYSFQSSSTRFGDVLGFTL